jgi:hypothetical protein
VINHLSRLCLVIPMTLLLPLPSPAQQGDSQVANSEEPYFQKFSPTIPHAAHQVRAVYNQGAFANNGQPRVALVPDGRIFLVWNAAIGFARGDRIAGSFSSDGGRTWSESLELINNPDRDDGDPAIIIDGRRLLVMSFSMRMPDKWDKFNPFPSKRDVSWWSITESDDGGKTWSRQIDAIHPHRLAGHRTNGIRLENGILLLPYYYDAGSERGDVPELERDMREVAGVARSTDGGRTWVSGQMMENCGADDCDEPAVVLLSTGELFCLLRTMTDRLYESHSSDYGRTWDAPKPSPILTKSEGIPFALHRLENRPADELVIAYNYPDRSSLVVSYSPNGGRTWTGPKLVSRPNVDAGFRADNPSICQTKDGIIVLAWQQESLPRHLEKDVWMARFNRAWLLTN